MILKYMNWNNYKETTMKDKLFKFKVSNLDYAMLIRNELDSIKKIIGDYEVVKTRNCLGGFNIKLWCKKKEDTNQKIIDEIIEVYDKPGFPENREEDIYDILKKYGKVD